MSVTSSPPAPLERLKAVLGEISDVLAAEHLLDWDSRVSMPHRGASARAEAAATLTRLAHERFIAKDVGDLLDAVANDELQNETDAALVRATRREWDRAIRVPPELSAEMSHASGIAVAAWDEAKAASDFRSFVPHLERQVELKLRYIDCFPPASTPYDVLLDEYEEGMTTAQVADVFRTLREGLVPLVERTRAPDDRDAFMQGPFPVEAQRRAGLEILKALGYTEDEWRLDETPHPFASSPGLGDIRLTTHYNERDLHSIFSTMHEFGHGVYEWGVDPSLARTPLGHGASAALHESQSRTWENLVGRSPGFWRWFYPRLQALFPAVLGSVERERFLAGVNAVRPGLIRIDADEVTYGLHIILRFELEQDLLDGKVAVSDLANVWNERMHSYLGVDVPDDAHGVLQDMHWAGGLFGYFPTYQLGNVISVQIWRRAESELADLEEQFARGDFAPLREWLREHVYRVGATYPPAELLQRLTGSALDPGPYLEYLHTKFE